MIIRIHFLCFLLLFISKAIALPMTSNPHLEAPKEALALISSGLSSGKEPLIISSLDNGDHWTFRTPANLPTLTENSNLHTVSCNDSVCVALGERDNSVGVLPFLLVSSDGGKKWSYARGDNQPVGSYVFSFSDMTCSEMVCIAPGSYYLKGGQAAGVILSSRNKGRNWLYQFTAVNSKVLSASCDGNTCAAVGNITINNISQFLLENSKNGGMRWLRVLKPDDFPKDILQSELNSVSCQGPSCVAAGMAITLTNQRPLLIVSRNNGNNWMYELPNNLPSGLQRANLNTAICTKQSCLAAGFYDSGNGSQPLIVANTHGKNWSFVEVTNLPHGIIDANITQMKCDSPICVAIGIYEIGDGKGQKPLLLESKDSGEHWSFIVPANYPIMENGMLISNTCTLPTCTAVGMYYKDRRSHLLLFVSTDKGEHWSYITPTNLPTDAIHSHLYSTSCQGSVCFAGGYYNAGRGPRPLLVVSTDGGVHWTSKQVFNLPFDRTSLSLASASSAVFK